MDCRCDTPANRRGRTTKDVTTTIEFWGRDTVSDPLTEMLRKDARELLQTAVEAELEAFLAQFADHQTPEGRAWVVRNGHHPERAVGNPPIFNGVHP